MKSHPVVRVFVLGGAILLQSAICLSAYGAGKAKAPAASATVVKKVLSISDIPNVQIDVPISDTNGPGFYDFGPELQAALINALETKYNFAQTPRSNVAALATTVAPPSSTDGPIAPWTGPLVPAATLSFHVTALVFRSGGGGDSMFYGFDEHFRTIYNDGSGKLINEFPLSPIDFQQGQFDAAFNDRGTAPFDSQGGLDLGEGFQLDALVAWVGAKWASYHSEIRMQVTMDAPLVGRHEVKEISVNGHGFFFDIVAGYLQFSGEIGLARKDAMTVAFNNAFAGSSTVIDTWMKTLPQTAYLYGVISPTEILLDTGSKSNVPVGTHFTVAGHPELVLEVTQAVDSGSVAKLDSGNVSALQVGMTLVESTAVAAPQLAQVAQNSMVASAAVPVAAETVNLPKTNLPKADYSGVSGLQIDWGQAFLKSLVEFPLLPYRIWRYFQYDESFHGTSAQIAAQEPVPSNQDYVDDVTPRPGSSSNSPENLSDEASVNKDGVDSSLSAGALAWSAKARSQAWAKQIGLNQAPVESASSQLGQTGGAPVLVAIIDSGVDYNHPALRDSIWVNPTPFVDPLGHSDTLGWDFISGDQRPYDDLYRGTEVASALLAVAPEAIIMPVKAFNPWGVTSSAALYASFEYAVDHGAQIIVCSWATRRETTTMQAAVQYARDHGVLVVAAAGDRGDDMSKAGNAAYPATLSKTFDNVLTVAGVDSNDKLVQVSAHFSNFDPSSVQIAAPGENIQVADPRSHSSSQTSTGLAAAIVAGQVVRNLTSASASHGAAGTYHDWIKLVLSQADVVPSLSTAVQGGLRLHVR
jgi:hypothetical protein